MGMSPLSVDSQDTQKTLLNIYVMLEFKVQSNIFLKDVWLFMIWAYINCYTG